MVPSQDQRRSSIHFITGLVGFLASSAIDIFVMTASIFDAAPLIFLRTDVVRFHDSQPYIIVQTTDALHRRRRSDRDSAVLVSTLWSLEKRAFAISIRWITGVRGSDDADCIVPK